LLWIVKLILNGNPDFSDALYSVGLSLVMFENINVLFNYHF